MGPNLYKSANYSPLSQFVKKQGFVILDGGLATELEKRGHDLNHQLWSARLLDSEPEAIADVHYAYLLAGADCIITASYQGSFQGFLEAGYSQKEAFSLLNKSVEIACEARDRFNSERDKHNIDSISPLVAASIGPYGAYLADGSEYHGRYTISASDLLEFHEERFTLLAKSAADILACETIPSYREAEILQDLIMKHPEKFYWISFSCRDQKHIRDGSPIDAAVSLFSDNPHVLAVGANCTAPRYILGLIEKIKSVSNHMEIIIYPNSGESYDAVTKKWLGESDPPKFASLAEKWFKSGARIIGGCCRTSPDHIRELRLHLKKLIEGVEDEA